jgi:hypothetical protein
MTISLMQLWIPIVGSAVLTWIASGLFHMLIKHHNSDYQKLENEDDVADAVGRGSPKLGLHHFPHCADMSEMASESMQERFKKGPIGMVIIFPNGLPNMGKLLGQQLVYFLLGSTLIAYCASFALPAGSDFSTVFRVFSSIGFAAYGWATIPFSIWFGFQWSMTVKYLIDALIYAVIVAATFAWLWPAVV